MSTWWLIISSTDPKGSRPRYNFPRIGNATKKQKRMLAARYASLSLSLSTQRREFREHSWVASETDSVMAAALLHWRNLQQKAVPKNKESVKGSILHFPPGGLGSKPRTVCILFICIYVYFVAFWVDRPGEWGRRKSLFHNSFVAIQISKWTHSKKGREYLVFFYFSTEERIVGDLEVGWKDR